MLVTRVAVIAFIAACGFVSTQIIASPVPPAVTMDLPAVPAVALTPPEPAIGQVEAEPVFDLPALADDHPAIEDEIVPVAASAEAETPAAAEPLTKTLTVGKGDTLMKLLTSVGISAIEAQEAISVLAKHFDPRRMNIGQTIEVHLEDVVETAEDAVARLKSLHIVPGYDRLVSVARVPDGFKATQEERPLQFDVTLASGRIGTSLYEAAVEAGLPQPILMELIRAYSWDVDFQRDVQPGDTFQVMYDRYFDERGTVVHNGDILMATMTLSGQRMPLYRFTTPDGTTDYYDPKGRSVRKALLRTPVDGARLSSGFGKRNHPILGYSKMHTGVDFAVPQGTPIYAAGEGVVEKAGTFGGYGNYIRLRHTTDYSTAYGHLSGYARGVSAGKHVKQGQIIGYAGATGMATGPHLHYEILHDGHAVNPMGVRMPFGRQLQGREFQQFVAARDATDRQFAAVASRTEVATRH